MQVVCGSGAAFVPLCWLLLEWRQFFLRAPSLRSGLLAGAFLLGWRCPEIALSRLAARRRVRLETGIPDALDLLVICAQAGLSLDHAVEQVSAVLSRSSRDVAEEFAATAAEMRVSAVRGQALENLAQRTGLTSLRSIVAALSQSIKFGTPLSEALRVLAAQMRVERLARFEERAARLPVLLTMPLMAFILPSLMIVIGTPSSALKGTPAAHRASDAVAWASAPAASITYIALIFASHAAMRASAARVTSTGESCLAR